MASSVDNAAADSPVEIFCSYSHDDEAHRLALYKQLAALRREGVAVYWDDRKIEPSEEWKKEIDQRLNTADVILLLISASFINSDYCYAIEMQRAMQRYEAGEAQVVPIIVEPCDWKKLPFEKLQVLPKSAKPVTKWENRAEAFASAAEGIRKVVEKVRARPRIAVPSLAGAAKPQKERRLPAIWNVPHNRNRNFAGREAVLTRLHEALATGGAAALTQAITGLGGVGKTQTAIEFAYRYSGDYELVWWIRSEEPAKLAADYAGLARPLGIKEEKELNVTVQTVRAELTNRARWLLVFDNANTPAEVRDYLPQAGSGHVLITSRNHDWLEVAEPLAITTWQRDESVAFLLKRTKQKDERSANQLAEALGDLPLALEQAAANIVAGGGSLTGYLKTLREHTREVLRRGKAPAGYHATVATTWEISFVEVGKESEAAGQLMNLCAFLAPDDIGREMLRAGAEELPEPLAAAVADDLLWGDAVGTLRKYSLVEVQDGGISVHRLVQAVVRDRLEAGGRKEWGEAAVSVVNAAFPYEHDNIETWVPSSRVLPHALAAADHAEKLQVGVEACGGVLNDVGRYARMRAELPTAKTVLERALRLGEEAYGPDHPNVIGGLNNLGVVLQDLGDLSGARTNFERALKVTEAAYGPSHPQVAIYVSNLGSVQRRLGDLAGARANFERALRMTEAAYGLDHPQVAIYENNLGGVLQDQGDLAGARASFERALKMTEAVYGPDHPTVAIRVNNLGLVLKELGDLAGARESFERALKIQETTYGANHPAVAIDVNNLGGVLKDSGDLVGARTCFEKALRIEEAAYGPDHPDVARSANNLGLVFQEQGDLAEARECFERAVRIWDRSLGRDHPKTKSARGYLGRLS